MARRSGRGAGRAKEGHRLPMTVGGLGLKLLSAQAPSAQGRHIGLGPGLIAEDKPPWIDLPLMGLPACPLAGEVSPVLLAWQDGFF